MKRHLVWARSGGLHYQAPPHAQAIPTADYPTPAARPLNSRLDCRATLAAFGIGRPDRAAALPVVIDQYRRYHS